MNKKDKEKFMGRPLQGIEDRGKPKPQEAPFFDGTYRRPNDATAAMVMQKATEEGKYQFKSVSRNVETFDICPELGWLPKNIKNYKGQRFGRLTCVGYGHNRVKWSESGKKKNTVYWVMKCDCGRYEYRTQWALKLFLKNGGVPMCGICKKLELVRERNRIK